MLDFDATDDRVHGQQVGHFYHGYYDHYCFLPLYVFCADQLLVSYLHPSKIDAAKHAWAVLALLVKAGHTARGSNPRYVITNLTGAPQRLYDAVYCARLGTVTDP